MRRGLSRGRMLLRKRWRKPGREIHPASEGTILRPKAEVTRVANMNFLLRRDILFAVTAHDRSKAGLAD
jgi:hypothetical protein